MTEYVENVSGGCYCGKVRYQASRVSADITECHCSQCRKQSGHRYAVTLGRKSDLRIEGEDNITWFRASPAAERGFCSTCGSHLFWRSLSEDDLGILAASIDDSHGLRLANHIFVDDKAGYYEIADGLPQFIGEDQPYPPE